MGYAINIILAWLLQDQIDIPAEHLDSVFEVTRFVAFIYAIPWFRSPFVADAAFLELEMFKSLGKYQR